MNHIRAVVTKIESMDNLTMVAFDTQNQFMQMMSLGLNTNISVGSVVTLGAKASNIALAKEFYGMISISNQLNAIVKSVNNGELLSSIKIMIGDYQLESVVSLKSAKHMNLQVGDKVVALIKASELSILEVSE